MRILFEHAGARDFRKLDRQVQVRITTALERLATGAGDVKALHGSLAGRVRLRVGPWRIHFDRTALDTIRVLQIEKRGDAYRD